MTISVVGDKCCGCRTCDLSCPTGAIRMAKDKFAFEMPIVDAEKCIDCGKCVKVCPVLNKDKVEHKEHLLCGAAHALDKDAKFKGSSGGLFGLLAKKVLAQEGIVYGAAFDERHQLYTTKAENEGELLPLYKSKYLLCNTNGEFVNIKKSLEDGRAVLYCSSPCQIAALKLWLRKDYENLFLVEFVCHGVGNQTMFDKSIRFVEEKKKIKIKKFSMRYKTKAVSSHYYYMQYDKNGRTYEKSDLYLMFPYYNAYSDRLVCRESCFDCKYAHTNRVADITIADFHTIEKYLPEIDRFGGVSMFVCNTEKGVVMFENIREQLFVKEMPWEVIVGNNRFSNDERKPKNWEDFLKLSIRNYPEAVSKYLNPYKDWKFYYYKCPKFIRNLAQKILKK